MLNLLFVVEVKGDCLVEDILNFVFDFVLVVEFCDLNFGVELNVEFWLLIGILKVGGVFVKVRFFEVLNIGVGEKEVDVNFLKMFLEVVVVEVVF